MFNILPLILILIGLAILGYLVTKKIPAISNLNLSTMPEEKMKQVKHRILDSRIKRKIHVLMGKIKPWASKVKAVVADRVEETKAKLEDMHHEASKPETPTGLVTKEDFQENQEFISDQLEKAEEFADDDNFEAAEKKFINIIAHDPKNNEAYEGLGDLYLENKKFDEAEESFRFLLKLNHENSRAMFRLVELYSLRGKLTQALEYSKYALVLEPKNPKFLNAIIDIAIALKDRVTAEEYLVKLSEVNPENEKIAEMQGIIASL